MFDWLRKLISRFFKPKAKPEPDEDVGQMLRRRYQEERAKSPPRTTIRPSDGGMRKLSRHRGGRQYEKRRGIDHTKRMDGEFHDTPRPRKKKRGWAENRDKQRRN